MVSLEIKMELQLNLNSSGRMGAHLTFLTFQRERLSSLLIV